MAPLLALDEGGDAADEESRYESPPRYPECLKASLVVLGGWNSILFCPMLYRMFKHHDNWVDCPFRQLSPLAYRRELRWYT